MADTTLTQNNKLPITTAENDYLNKLRMAGDRTGMYLAYYNMTGSEEATLQAKISSFSGIVGGVAYGANSL